LCVKVLIGNNFLTIYIYSGCERVCFIDINKYLMLK
jgi:hypothetical protein